MYSHTTENSSAPPAACWSCRGAIEAGDRFCKHCGRRQMRGDTWYFQAGWILFLSFTVLGPFALPLVWRSPVLTSAQKWIVGGLIAVYSALVLILLFVLTKMIFSYFWDLNSSFRALHI